MKNRPEKVGSKSEVRCGRGTEAILDMEHNFHKTEEHGAHGELLDWQKKIIDARLKKIADDPTCLRPIETLFDDLNKLDD
jgi:methyl coenzyme M reductase subunit C-like uncharacterized protein (methanogenesis marker protein 7)